KYFNSLTGELRAEAVSRNDPTFHPLVVGVTWPSLLQLSEWWVVPVAVAHGMSFSTKASEAEDIGAHQLRAILSTVLGARRQSQIQVRPHEQHRPPPRIVFIGHSFGARALVSALAGKAALDPGFDDRDRAILLEGAFDVSALFATNGKL